VPQWGVSTVEAILQKYKKSFEIEDSPEIEDSTGFVADSESEDNTKSNLVGKNEEHRKLRQKYAFKPIAKAKSSTHNNSSQVSNAKKTDSTEETIQVTGSSINIVSSNAQV